MARDTQKPDQPSHADLWEEIRTVERDLKRLVLGVAGGMQHVRSGHPGGRP